jgi:hypothetical protein
VGSSKVEPKNLLRGEEADSGEMIGLTRDMLVGFRISHMYLCWERKIPAGTRFTSTPRKKFRSPRSFIGKTVDNSRMKASTIAIVEPVSIISST